MKVKIKKSKKRSFKVILHSKSDYNKTLPFVYVFDSYEEAFAYAEEHKEDSCAEIKEINLVVW